MITAKILAPDAAVRYTAAMAAISPERSLADLSSLSAAIRRDTMIMAHRAKSGHLGPALSIVDILVSLYFHFLRIDPGHCEDPERDRFILSKGHGCSSLYVTLAHRGFFPTADLETYLQDGSLFTGHASCLLPGIELSTGSLGHGLSVALGMALAARLKGHSYRSIALLSDGECDEGSTWEAILAAGHWKTSGLIAIVDYNKIQSFGRVSEVMELEPFSDKWRAFRWHVQEVDGHSHEEILRALAKAGTEEKPSVIIAHTVKGKGIPSLEDTVASHYLPLKDPDLETSLRSLS